MTHGLRWSFKIRSSVGYSNTIPSHTPYISALNRVATLSFRFVRLSNWWRNKSVEDKVTKAKVELGENQLTSEREVLVQSLRPSLNTRAHARTHAQSMFEESADLAFQSKLRECHKNLWIGLLPLRFASDGRGPPESERPQQRFHWVWPFSTLVQVYFSQWPHLIP